MLLKELFFNGFSVENYLNIASKEDSKKFYKTLSNIEFSSNSLKKINAIGENIYIVVSVETWCPYARTFVATIKKLNEINKNINISFITMGRGLEEVIEILEIAEDDFIIPTALILDKNFELTKSFIGFPKKYSKTGLEESKDIYFDGLLADEIIEEIL